MAIINGTVDPDTLLGTADPDTISGEAGNDTIAGIGGDDTILGGAGDDSISGNDGADSLEGGEGNDSVHGGNGNDVIVAGAGNDTLNGGAGNDTSVPGLGADVAFDGGGKDDLLVIDYTLSTTPVTMEGPTLLGPITEGGRPPGGNFPTSWGAGLSVADGQTQISTGFDSTQYDTLWYSPLVIGAAMDGAIDAPGEMMIFASAVGGVLTYTGTTTVQTVSGPVQIFTKYVTTILSGAGEWVPSAPLGIVAGGDYAAVVTGEPLSVKEEILASTTVDGVYQPLRELFDALATAGTVETTSRAWFYFDDGGFTGRIEDGEGNGTGFNGMERFDIGSGSGDDSITTAAGADTIRGGGGNDTLAGGGGNDSLVGGSGNDSIDGGAGADTLHGGSGDDVYIVIDADDTIVEVDGEGIDNVLAAVSHTLAAGVEHLELSDAAVNGTGNGLANQISGTHFANVLAGMDGEDVLMGLLGNDSLLGGSGRDTLDGGDGNDILTGGGGVDAMLGGLGNDIYSVMQAGEVVLESADEGTDRVDTNLGTYTLGENLENLVGTRTLGQTLTGNTLANVIAGAGGADILNGKAGADVLNGGGGNDKLTGGTGLDTMRGGVGTDTLDGGGGNDLLVGGAGRDVLAGGLGGDRFDYNLVSESGPLAAQQDLIQAFQRGFDRIDLSTIDANAGLAGNQAFAFIGNAAFSAAGQVRAVQVSGATLLEVNTAGTGGAEMVIRLAGTVPLTASDLVL
jgi:Ca2+-binding RTX toxin-like protein